MTIRLRWRRRRRGEGNPILGRKWCGSGATAISTAATSLCPRFVVNNNNNNNNNNHNNNYNRRKSNATTSLFHGAVDVTAALSSTV